MVILQLRLPPQSYFSQPEALLPSTLTSQHRSQMHYCTQLILVSLQRRGGGGVPGIPTPLRYPNVPPVIPGAGARNNVPTLASHHDTPVKTRFASRRNLPRQATCAARQAPMLIKLWPERARDHASAVKKEQSTTKASRCNLWYIHYRGHEKEKNNTIRHKKIPPPQKDKTEHTYLLLFLCVLWRILTCTLIYDKPLLYQTLSLLYHFLPLSALLEKPLVTSKKASPKLCFAMYRVTGVPEHGRPA